LHLRDEKSGEKSCDGGWYSRVLLDNEPMHNARRRKVAEVADSGESRAMLQDATVGVTARCRAKGDRVRTPAANEFE
jgi:hypothetical protein